MGNTEELFLQLVRLGIGKRIANEVRLVSNDSNSVDWNAIKTLADEQGLTAVVLDGISSLIDSAVHGLLQIDKLQWIGEVEYNYERYYATYINAISSLARFYNKHGYKMMVLKGYACSLYWPRPEHRPCGDIDIWLFGKQKEADIVLGEWFKAQGSNQKIDNSHHHHTVFSWRDFAVENFYDFFNIHVYKSNEEFDAILKELAQDDTHHVELFGEKVYLPSSNLHALFLIRHIMGHFSSTYITIRQLLDWAFFIKEHGVEIDWKWLSSIIEKFHMKVFFNCINAICVEDLGFDPRIFGGVQFCPSLKERILRDIIEPEFGREEPHHIIPRLLYKYKRWKGNSWKRRLCYNESMWSAFWSGVWSHLLKPSSI